MSHFPEIASIVALAAMFIIATIRGINMGILGFLAAFAVGGLILGMTPNEYLAGFPIDLFVTLFGITFLFGLAQQNGTIRIIVLAVMRLSREKILLAPWLFFSLTAGLESAGVLFAVPIVAPFAMSFASHYGLNRLMTGLMLIHGALGGSFSPFSVYGIFINGFLEENDIRPQPVMLFLVPLIVNTLIATVVFLIFYLRRSSVHDPHREKVSLSDPTQSFTEIDTLEHSQTLGSIGLESTNRPTRMQVLTLVGIVLMIIGVVGFGLHIGMLALTIGAVIAVIRPADAPVALRNVSWSVLVLLSGVLTYIALLKTAGTEMWLSTNIATIGIPILVVLLLFYFSGIVSALASSLGMMGVILALATPLLHENTIPVGGFVAGMAIATTVVDVSPFSPNGAMLLAGVSSAERDRFYRQILAYSGVMVAVGPAIGWLIAIVPTWVH